MNANPNNPSDALDQATAARLAKLATLPVDTSRLDARLRSQLPAPTPASHRRWPRLGLRPLQAAAAGLVLVAALLAVVIASSRPAIASAQTLAQLHDDLSSGRAPVIKVSSIEDAAAMLSRQWRHVPALPDMPDDHVMACCVHDMGRKKMAVVALDIDGAAVTLAVADASDIKSPQGDAVERRGVTYRVQSSAGVNMAMTQRSGRWICLMGRVDVERLIDVLAQSTF